MPRLTGLETTLLVYLAQFPKAEDKDAVLERLSVDARKIAEELIGNDSGNAKAKSAAAAILERINADHNHYQQNLRSNRKSKDV